MNIYTEAELIAKIKALDAQIVTAQGVSEYELDTGQGEQRVRRQSLSELLKLRDYWVTELSKVSDESGGLMYGNFHR